jgi:hypothetical protein
MQRVPYTMGYRQLEDLGPVEIVARYFPGVWAQCRTEVVTFFTPPRASDDRADCLRQRWITLPSLRRMLPDTRHPRSESLAALGLAKAPQHFP